MRARTLVSSASCGFRCEKRARSMEAASEGWGTLTHFHCAFARFRYRRVHEACRALVTGVSGVVSCAAGHVLIGFIWWRARGVVEPGDFGEDAAGASFGGVA